MKVFCIGNGESRKLLDLNMFKPHGKTYGCNALYRDFTSDVLISVDQGIMHEIYQSGYCDKNETWFRNWTRVPGMSYESLVYGSMSDADKQVLNKHESSKQENDRGDRQEFVFHGSNLAGTVNVLKTTKEITKQEVNHTSTFVSWVSENDKANCLNDLVSGEDDRGYACGASSGRVALINEKDLQEIYLIGHDLVSNDYQLNNMYKGTKFYGLPENEATPPVNWISQWKTLMEEHQKVTFYKVNPEGNNGTTQVSSNIDEWNTCKNVKYITYQNTLDKFAKA
jgi:hypothetical protein|tara:strand:+ start:5095 stop:5940 length:846 start_codon:yes stop_codon:yes gene_type:complete